MQTQSSVQSFAQAQIREACAFSAIFLRAVWVAGQFRTGLGSAVKVNLAVTTAPFFGRGAGMELSLAYWGLLPHPHASLLLTVRGGR